MQQTKYLQKSRNKIHLEEVGTQTCSLISYKQSVQSSIFENERENAEAYVQLLKDTELQQIDTVGLLAAKDSIIKMRDSRRSSLKEPSFEEVETGNFLINYEEELSNGGTATMNIKSKDKTSLSENIGVSFESLDVIRIPDEISLGKPQGRGSRTSMMRTSKTTLQALQLEPILVSKKSSPKKPGSRLSLARDSLILHRNSLRSSFSGGEKSPTKMPPHTTKRYSRISLHRDSLELIRHQSVVRKDSMRNTLHEFPMKKIEMIAPVARSSRLSLHRDSLEILRHKSIVPKEIEEEKPRVLMLGSPSVNNLSFEKVQRIITPQVTARTEVVKLPTPPTRSVSVNFSPITDILEPVDVTVTDSPWNIYKSDGEFF